MGHAAIAVAAAMLAATAGACGGGGRDGGPPTSAQQARDGAQPTTPAQPAGGARRSVTTIAEHVDVPWDIAFLPGGAALVSERETGNILRIGARGGRPRVVMRVPGVDTEGTAEGGLLGIAVSPTYRRDRWVYAYLTTDSDNRIVRFRLGARRVHPILTGLRRGAIHDGGALQFGPDGMLYVGVGETGDSALAQDRQALNGKILRIEPDGGVPEDNPFGNAVWSYGHRNVEGLAWDRQGRLWATELGQNEFDEVNLIRRGRNYGWPVVEGRGPTHGGRFTNPKVTWPTSEASPAGAAIAGRTLYIGALQGRGLLRVRLHGTRARRLPPLLEGRYGRLRAVAVAPDGALWVGTSNRDGRGGPTTRDDRILRLRVP